MGLYNELFAFAAETFAKKHEQKLIDFMHYCEERGIDNPAPAQRTSPESSCYLLLSYIAAAAGLETKYDPETLLNKIHVFLFGSSTFISGISCASMLSEASKLEGLNGFENLIKSARNLYFSFPTLPNLSNQIEL